MLCYVRFRYVVLCLCNVGYVIMLSDVRFRYVVLCLYSVSYVVLCYVMLCCVVLSLSLCYVTFTYSIRYCFGFLSLPSLHQVLKYLKNTPTM